MVILSYILQIALPILYGVSSLWYAHYFFKKSLASRRAATGTLAGSIALHLGYMVVLGLQHGRHPMATIFEFLAFVAMCMAFIYLFVEKFYRNAFIGAFVVPAIFILQLCASIGLNDSTTVMPILKEVRYALHATMFAAAYAAFFLGLLFSIMVILFERSIRQHRFGIVFEQFPSLDSLATMTAATLSVGFIFMSVGIGLGTWNAMGAHVPFHVDAKIILTTLIWLLYGAAIFYRYVLRCSDRATAIFSISGFILLTLSTVASHLTFASWHTFIG